MARFLFSVYVWLYYSILFLVFFILISIVFLLTLPFDRYNKITNRMLAFMAKLMMRPTPSWKMHIEGEEKYDATKPTIFIANHQSFMDIPLAFQLKWKMKWVVKHSMTYIPVMGWMVKLTGHLTINRSSKSALKKLSKLVQPLKDLVPVMIFPEGTRSLDGTVKNFKNGAFLLAKEHGFIIQPIVIDGAYSALASGSKLFNPKAKFKLKVLDSIDPDAFESMTALRDHAREVIISAHEQLKHS